MKISIVFILLSLIISCRCFRGGSSDVDTVAIINNSLLDELQRNHSNMWCPDYENWKMKRRKITESIKLNLKIWTLTQITGIPFYWDSGYCYTLDYKNFENAWKWLEDHGNTNYKRISLEEFEIAISQEGVMRAN